MSDQPNTPEAIMARYDALLAEGNRIYTVTTGPAPDEGEAPATVWDREVERTVEAFGFTHFVTSSLLAYRWTMLTRDEKGDRTPRASDDYYHQLIWGGDQQMLLSMTDIRDPFNYHSVHIARFPLDSRVIASLPDLVQLDNARRELHPDAE